MKAFFLLALLLPLLACAQQPVRTLVWSDEFSSGGSPDSTRWTAETGGHGWGNNELQYYTSAKENLRVENGLLIIEARKETFNGKNYTSARLTTKHKGDWQYGRIEVRAKLPRGRGTWPAIWMLASKTPFTWPNDGEIDIMEHVGYDHGLVHATVHCKNYYHSIGTQKSDTLRVDDCAETFHVYSVDWSKDSVTAAVDGKTFFRFANEQTGYAAWPFDNTMHLLLNLAVGGNWGGARGVDETIWPCRLEVDYVQVYQ